MAKNKAASTPSAPATAMPAAAPRSASAPAEVSSDLAGQHSSNEPAVSEPEVGVRFEDALGRLELVVDRLEEGELDLEASLAAFEEGVRLSRTCAKQLDVAEQRVEILVREAGSLTKRLFEAGDDAERGGDRSDDDDVDPSDAADDDYAAGELEEGL